MMLARTLPSYDAQRDGNPFAWIIAAAQEVRAERQAEIHARQVIEQINRRAEMAQADQP